MKVSYSFSDNKQVVEMGNLKFFLLSFLITFVFFITNLDISFYFGSFFLPLIMCLIVKKDFIKTGLLYGFLFTFFIVILTIAASLILPSTHPLLEGTISSSYFLGLIIYIPLGLFEGLLAGAIAHFTIKRPKTV